MSQETATDSPAASLTISNAEFIQLSGISRGHWYALKAQGAFAGLESPIPNRWSRMKVEAFLSGRSASDRRRAPRVA